MSFKKDDGLEREPIPFGFNTGDYLDQDEVLVKAISHYGEKLQINQTIQELSELTKELTEYVRREALHNEPLNIEELTDEIADVEIMIEQLKMIFGNHDEVYERRKFKIRRLWERLNKTNKGE